ncbi:hypothetical protein [uncultured Pseudomonas sp.]|uniref:terminase small subunit-like protein n=1 Tax=uncultured Pseudomonas sp. TaxID=114707 RepID=UPI0030DC5762|tara:strand:+ start:14202 stop:14804 length:603 start_codon:yes stop_codon:yes gene_type:complete
MKTEQAGKKPATPKAKKKPVAKKAAGSSVRASKAKPIGRPTAYSDLVAAKLCAYIADGMSLRNVCKQPGMPSMTTVLRWLGDDAMAAFRMQYACAREAQADLLAEQILDIADEECTMVRADKHGSNDDDGEGHTEVVFDSTAVARNRLRVDARKWLASKMAPKKYGDKLQTELTGANGGAIAVNSTVTFVRPPERAEDDQ